MTTPVTVIVPVYNGEKHLLETLNSLLHQSWKAFELIVIDDGSRDQSPAILQSIRDPRVRVIRQENQGLCHALNRGIAEARTPFVARNDQDDLSLPHRLERQLQVLQEHPEALALFCYYTKFGAKRGWSNADKVTVVAGEVKPFEPFQDGCLLGSTLFARTEALRSVQGFRQAYYPADDWDLELRLVQLGQIRVLREALVAYRFHGGANTYRLFAQMQAKGRWAEASYQRRQQGQPEQSFDQFLASQPQHWTARWERRRLDTAKLHLRVAGQSYLDGHYVRAAFRLLTAALWDPANCLQRARRMINRPNP